MLRVLPYTEFEFEIWTCTCAQYIVLSKSSSDLNVIDFISLSQWLAHLVAFNKSAPCSFDFYFLSVVKSSRQGEPAPNWYLQFLEWGLLVVIYWTPNKLNLDSVIVIN
jgi:hypothetical protein